MQAPSPPFDDRVFLTKVKNLYDLWCECLISARGPAQDLTKNPNVFSAPVLLRIFGTPEAAQVGEHLKEASLMAADLLAAIDDPVLVFLPPERTMNVVDEKYTYSITSSTLDGLSDSSNSPEEETIEANRGSPADESGSAND